MQYYIIVASHCTRAVDLVFAIDASGSVGQWGYFQEQMFVRRVVQRFGISQSGTHVAVIEYSTRAKAEIPLTRFYSYSRFYYALGKLPYKRGETRIDLALKVAAEDVFGPEGGSRSNVPKILVLMTDGSQTHRRGVIPLDKAVLPLLSKGVKVFALAIGNYPNKEELRLIVEKKDHIFKSNSFSVLLSIIDHVTTTTCREGEC